MSHEKIKPSHLERAAYVYVRQSSMHQVRHHHESRRRQYGLAEHARSLGFRQVAVIDDDLGRSGSGSEERPGFGRLVTAVCEGRAGAVLALEASRLARNNRDWHHLIDLCAMTDALVIDDDGIYDPRQLNDRLLLGLKGTMSEFELGLLRQRAQEALRLKIQRGEVLSQPAIGYIRTEKNGLELIPDRQVQDAIRGVFAKFSEMGSVRQVLLWYRQEGIPLPTWRTPEGNCTEVVWKLPGYPRIRAILKNPVYAGAFVHGRTRTKTVVVDGRARKSAGHDMPRDQWEVLIQDHHPGYISWQHYLRNQEQLVSNGGMQGRMTKGAPKSGPALLAGLLRCGRCGRKLHVGYSGNKGRVPRYFCRGGHLNHGTEWCISFGGLRVDQAIETKVLETLQPAGVEASVDAWERSQQEEDQKHRALRLALDKARYEADRVRRQYDAADPENRLVAGELESRWNKALEHVAELEGRLAQVTQAEPVLAETDRTRLLELGQDLESLWHHPAAPVTLKKRILRTVLEEIVADIAEESSEVVMWLHWAGGVHTELRIPRNRTGQHRHGTDREVVDLVRDLANVCQDLDIARILNRLGHHTGFGKTWTESRVRSVRARYSIPAFSRDADRSWLTLVEVGRELNVSANFVRTLVDRKILPGRQVVRACLKSSRAACGSADGRVVVGEQPFSGGLNHGTEAIPE